MEDNLLELRRRESKARGQLKSQGFILQKRTNHVDISHSGHYRILEGHNRNIVAGENFDMCIEDVERFIAE